MESVSWRNQLRLVAWGYAGVLAFSAVILYGRHLQELLYPIDASGGMWAFGDAILYIFIICLFMIPTLFMIWVIAKSESVYEVYSRILLGLSLSAPICLGLFLWGESSAGPDVGIICLFRLLSSPFILAGIGASWLAARFDQAKKMVSYALLIEGITFLVSVALFIHWASTSRR